MHLIRMSANCSAGLGGICCQHPMACRAQDFARHFANECLVLNQEDGSTGSCASQAGERQLVPEALLG